MERDAVFQKEAGARCCRCLFIPSSFVVSGAFILGVTTAKSSFCPDYTKKNVVINARKSKPFFRLSLEGRMTLVPRCWPLFLYLPLLAASARVVCVRF